MINLIEILLPPVIFIWSLAGLVFWARHSVKAEANKKLLILSLICGPFAWAIYVLLVMFSLVSSISNFFNRSW